VLKTITITDSGTYTVFSVPNDKIYRLVNIYYEFEATPGDGVSGDYLKIIDNYGGTDNVVAYFGVTEMTGALYKGNGGMYAPVVPTLDIELIGTVKIDIRDRRVSASVPATIHFELEEVEVKGGNTNVQTNE